MWFYSLNEVQHGPVSVAGLKSLLAQQVLTPQSLVWRQEMADWLPIEKTELAAGLALPLPEGDAWQMCSFSGDKARRSEMAQLDGFWVAAAHKDEAVEYLHQGGRLPKVELESNLTGSIELGHLMRTSWQMLSACLKPVCVLYLLVEIPANVLSTLVTSESMASGPMPAVWLVLLIQALASPFFNGGILSLFSRQLRGMQEGLGAALAAACSNWGRIFVVHFITLMMSLLGFLFLIIPGLLITIRLILSEAAAVDGQMPGSAAVQTSWNITEGHFWRTFGYLMLISLICGWPPVILDIVAKQIPALQHWLVSGVLTTLLQLPSMYLLAFMFSYYKELQARQRLETRHSA